MANLQVKGVPEALQRRLRRAAARQGRSMRDIVLDAVHRELAREELLARLARREPVDLGRPAALSLEEIRTERGAELGP
ncbi:MAG: toxin-antitoxin system HicB family antitoxin [Deltaproteobacteria bacterium]|nr:toxin-antitoxin system HicB family antitoxin [Deltaproteobacteria bacterium]